MTFILVTALDEIAASRQNADKPNSGTAARDRITATPRMTS